ncbi:unnamed protein product [Parnassius apollo]|uniref:Male-enhanced antigen 1 n=1 Tax=Parnassius apollo TaxID=110799 RepID=A0A8S3WNW7_PARAO|nr:unnamed protein product [Parnassius apollo]
MVCDGPEPPENSPNNLSPPPRLDLNNGNNNEESDDEQSEYFGYQPLPQGPYEASMDFSDSDDDVQNDEVNQTSVQNVPPIEPIETSLVREVWNTPRPSDSIEMDSERAQQVISAMANFALPQASIPEWAQSISEEQWKETLNVRLERLRNNR